MDESKRIVRIISNAKKKTPSIVFIRGKVNPKKIPRDVKYFTGKDSLVLVGDWNVISDILNEGEIEDFFVEIRGRYSALPLLDLRKVEARVEPGAIIRDGAKIGKDAIIMMGAVINIGAEIGERTMVDMNAVIGARAVIGNDSHIGAGAVIAGVLEPPGSKPVRIGDNCLIGANAVILEGIDIGDNSIVGAGSVVIDSIPAGKVAVGAPAKIVKDASEVAKEKKSILKELRNR